MKAFTRKMFMFVSWWAFLSWEPGASADGRWIFISMVYSPAAKTCSHPVSFGLSRDAMYMAESCELEEPILHGFVTKSEFGQVDALVTSMATNATAQGEFCEQGGPVTTELLRVAIEPDRYLNVVEISSRDKSVCYRGNLVDARALESLLLNLAEKYYPKF